MTTTIDAMFRSDFHALSLEALTAVHGGFSIGDALGSGAQWAGVGAATGAAIGAPTGAVVGGFATSPALGVGAFPGLVAGAEIGGALGGAAGWLYGVGSNVYDQLFSSAPAAAAAAR
jgi:hypothetical protein